MKGIHADRRHTRRLTLALLAVTAALAVVSAAAPDSARPATPPFRATLDVATTTPKANTKWPYVIHIASQANAPIWGMATVEIVDPTGTAHPVEYYNTTRKLTNWPFYGVFYDEITWPPSSRGYPLTLRVTITAAEVAAKRVLTAKVQVK